jgi:hypothetical protein
VVKKPSQQDKARLAMWATVIEFSLKAVRDELDMGKLMTDDFVDVLNHLNIGMEMFRRQLEI